MKSSNIGGQAVLEGIMMRNGDKYAVAVRKPNQEIEVNVEKYKSVIPWETGKKIPFIRGIFSFVDSLVLGMKTLTYSASFYEDEETDEKVMTAEEIRKQEKKDQIFMNLTIIISVVLAVAIFMVLPYFLSNFLKNYITSHFMMTVIEGIIRLAIFLAYISLVSHMKDIQRTFMYHGAEHKCINCVESGKALTVENVMKSSRFHKRCGTSFLFFVIIISIIFFIGFFAIVPVKTMWMRVVIRVLLVPVVAGVSYEFIRLAGNSENKVVALLSKPGLCMQKLTTKEPTPDMAEVAIMAVEAVFDWKAYLRENFENAEGEIKKAEEAEHTAGEANDNL